MERATPMKTRKERYPAALVPGMVLRRTKTKPTPQTNGTEIPATAMESARRPLRRMDRKSSSRSTRNRKKRWRPYNNLRGVFGLADGF